MDDIPVLEEPEQFRLVHKGLISLVVGVLKRHDLGRKLFAIAVARDEMDTSGGALAQLPNYAVPGLETELAHFAPEKLLDCQYNLHGLYGELEHRAVIDHIVDGHHSLTFVNVESIAAVAKHHANLLNFFTLFRIVTLAAARILLTST